MFLPALLGAGPGRLCALLAAVHGKRPLPELPPPAALAFQPGPGLDEALCRALGYRCLGNGATVALRADALERLAHEAYRLSEQGFCALTPKLKRLAGCDAAELETVLTALRYQVRRDDTGVSFGRAAARKGRGSGARQASKRAAKAGTKTGTRTGTQSDSPFAKLRDLEPGK